MTETLFLFASIGGAPIAVHAGEVEAVVRLGEVIAVPLAPGHVRGLAALRSRVLTVIDMEARIFGAARPVEPAPPASVPPASVPLAPVPLAIVAAIAAHSYGFLIDSVTDICRAPDGVQPLCGRMDPAWAPFVSGLVDHGGQSHLLLTLSDFVSAPGSALAA